MATQTKNKKRLVLNFTKQRETKGTVVFAEESDEPSIPALYIKKPAVTGMGNPESLKVTIDVA
jgi:hypothetical protein